jgi:hypothetical protein
LKLGLRQCPITQNSVKQRASPREGQHFASDGSAIGSEFQVNTYTTHSQRSPSVALASDGDFVVVWDSGYSNNPGSYGSDTTYTSIQGQRYAVPEPSSVVQLISGILGLLALNQRRRRQFMRGQSMRR